MDTTVIGLRVPKGRLVKVLIVEDEKDSAASLSDRLQGSGFSVDTAADPEQALQYLQSQRYQMVIADQVFPLSKVEGDEFLIRNLQLMQNAKKVLITGKSLNRIPRLKQLEELEVPVLVKGDDNTNQRLEEIGAEALRERTQELSSKVENAVPALLGEEVAPENLIATQRQYAGAMELLRKASEILVRHLSSQQNPDEKNILYDGREFSPNMLIKEIQQGTDVGKAHLDMVLDLMQHTWGLK